MRLDVDRLHRPVVAKDIGEVVKRSAAVGLRGRLADDDHVFDGRRVSKPRQHVLEEHVLDDQHAGLGRVEDVRDAGAARSVVDRHLDRPQLQDSKPRVEELRPVPHHDRDALALGDAEVPQARRDVPGSLGDLRVGHRVIVEDGKHPVAELCRLLVDKSH